jgi:hypothetical protein
MSGSDLSIPINETVWPRYFQSRILKFCLPIFKFMYLWAIYIFLGSVCLLCCSQWLILGIYKSLTDTWMQELGTRPRRPQSFISGNTKTVFSVFYCAFSSFEVLKSLKRGRKAACRFRGTIAPLPHTCTSAAPMSSLNTPWNWARRLRPPSNQSSITGGVFDVFLLKYLYFRRGMSRQHCKLNLHIIR